jgi:hypothetical protein
VLKSISVAVLVASFVAGSAIAGGSAVARDTNAQAAVGQAVALSDSDMSAAKKKAAKKAKKTTKAVKKSS